MSTRAQILAEIAAQFPDNTSGAITPAKLRQVTEDLANSCAVPAAGTGVIAAAIGAQAARLDTNLDAPLVVNAGEYLHVIVKMPLGTATASQVIRGVVGINGFFE